ncbi:uncharacterized protein LOC141685681 [Apium graveolens]|uniref:uncharacterized protein LOC141685681 n=1 Tax=Apium graveolens TaxID=4045 RepID=UPI003D7BF8C3
MEKLVYALILASRKLRPYFQAHRIEVRTTYPLWQVLHKSESSGRMLKWAVELGQFDLEYIPRTAIKGQSLADFLLEFDSTVDDKALVMLQPPCNEESLEEFPHPWWILHVDGAVNNGEAGAGIVLVFLEGHHLMSAIHFKFYATNNDAEYEVLINGLKISLEMGVRNLIARSDSELVVNQVNEGFQARGPWTELYLRCTQHLIGKFKEVRLECVPREKNNNADALAKMGSQQEAVLLGSIPLEIQEIPSIPEVEMMQVDEAPKEMWVMPILAYIHKGILPEDKFKARRLRYQAARYVVYDKVLYKRGFNQLLLRCVDEEEGNYILREVHEGICGYHSGGNSLAMKILRQGYYWPTMREDAVNFVKACDRCQHFANYSSMPVTLLTPMVSPWPFAMWGIDLIGELPKAKGDVKYAMVAVDYFTKWAEAMPLATITAKKIRGFVFNSIVCRFGIPYKLVSDNGKQFDTVYHPQRNGQTKAVNKIIKHTLKNKLEERKGNWLEELPKVMWSYNTTPRSTTGETPFMLTYGYEAMVPVEVGSGSLRRDRCAEEDGEVNQRLFRSFGGSKGKFSAEACGISTACCKVLKLRPLAMSFLSYKIGNGESISVWFDPWWQHTCLASSVSSPIISLSGLHHRDNLDVLICSGVWSLPTANSRNHHLDPVLLSWLANFEYPCLHAGSDLLLWNGIDAKKTKTWHIWDSIRFKAEKVPWYQGV